MPLRICSLMITLWQTEAAIHVQSMVTWSNCYSPVSNKPLSWQETPCPKYFTGQAALMSGSNLIIYSLVKWGTVYESGVLYKNITQQPRPALKHRLLDLKAKVLTIETPTKIQEVNKSTFSINLVIHVTLCKHTFVKLLM